MPAKRHNPGAPDPVTAVETESEGAGTGEAISRSSYGAGKTETVLSISVKELTEVLRRHEEPGLTAVMVDELTHMLGEEAQEARPQVRSRTMSEPVRAAAAQLIAGLRANRDSLPNGI